MSFDEPIEINGKKYIMVEVIEPPPLHEKMARLMFMSEINGRFGREAEDFAKDIYRGQATKDDFKLAKAHYSANRADWHRQLFENWQAGKALA